MASITWWEGMKMLEIFVHHSVVQVTDQNWISKTVYCIRCVMVCKIGFTNGNAKIALLRALMVVAYYIKFFQTGQQTERCFRACLHETQSEHKPVWNLNPLWKVVLFSWQFTSNLEISYCFPKLFVYMDISLRQLSKP